MSLKEGCLCRVHQTGNHILRIIHAQAVDDEEYLLMLVHACCQIIVDALEVATNIDSRIALQLIGLQLLLHRATLLWMDGRHDDEARTLRVLQRLLNHVLRRVLLHLLTAYGRVCAPYARVKQTEILVYLRRGAHRTAWIPRYHLLFDGDGWRYASDKVTLRFVHPSEELSGIARQRLYITPLALGIQCVEGQR